MGQKTFLNDSIAKTIKERFRAVEKLSYFENTAFFPHLCTQCVKKGGNFKASQTILSRSYIVCTLDKHG